MKLIAAIPNYNADANLSHLVKQLIEEKFDAIYVMDDGSTDDSLQVLYEFGSAITVIEGGKNLGPAGNRNRVSPYVEAGDIIVFIDADMELMSRKVRRVIGDLFDRLPHVGIIGGGIMTKNKKPMTYNFGVQTNRIGDGIGLIFERFAQILHFKLFNWWLRPLARRFTANLDIRYGRPKEQRVDWVSEGHCYIRGEVFKELNGFDETFRYHEGKDLALRARLNGWGVVFSPRIWTRHLELQVREKDENELRKEYEPQVQEKATMMLSKYSQDDDPFADEPDDPFADNQKPPAG
jgi:N-acetylglucosaminyl-diphospho-decaprenol L-rhamnosyltransferase